jgi:uncharacterized glyoxalase superfamily protein PhnB
VEPVWLAPGPWGLAGEAVEQADAADEGRLEAGGSIMVGRCTAGWHRERGRRRAPLAADPQCSTDVWPSRADVDGQHGRSQTMLRTAIPVLHVSSSAAAEVFYCQKLGFTREFAYRPTAAADPCYMGVVRDEARVHLSSFPGDGVAGSLVYLVVDDVDALHREFAEKGVPIEMAPTNQSWGNREMYVRDEDRNKIAFVLHNVVHEG